MKSFLLQAVVCSICFTVGFFHNPLWFWIPILLGLNLIQSAFTDFCPISRMFGGKRGTGSSKKSTPKS
jgi:hypothetical protein